MIFDINKCKKDENGHYLCQIEYLHSDLHRRDMIDAKIVCIQELKS